MNVKKSVQEIISKDERIVTMQFLRTALFWVVTQRVVVIPHRRFGTTYRSHLHGSKIEKRLEDGSDRLSRNGGKELPLQVP
jgi:hypothetical protein